MTVRVALALVCVLHAVPGAGQIVRDGTVGPAGGALSGPNFSIPATLGQQVGGNLFHSFSQFNVNTGESATFSGPTSVANVISRVTGTAATNIDGILRSTIPGANVWLINPHGVAFGAHASLDVQGSVYVSTADYLKLGSSGQFSATNPGASTLVSAPPSAFGFVGAPAAITVTGSTLQAATGTGLSLVGGDVSLSSAKLKAAAGQVGLASLASGGEVDATTLAGSGVNAYGTISANASRINASSMSGPRSGAVRIVGGNLVTSDLKVMADNSGASDGGGISMTLAGDLQMTGGNMLARSHGAGSAGNIVIAAKNLTAQGGALIESETAGQAAGGDIVLSIKGNLAVVGQSGGLASQIITDTTGSGQAGASGSIQVTAQSVTVAPNAVISTYTSSSGAGGSLSMTTDALTIGAEGSWMGAQAFGAGAAGSTTVTTKNIAITGSGSTLSGIMGDNNVGSAGAGGAVTVKADAITLAGPASISSDSYGSGHAGAVSVTASSIQMFNGARIGTQAWHAGDGGTTTVNVSGSLAIAGTDSLTGIFGDSNSAASGNAGKVVVTAGAIDVGHKGAISSDTYGTGDGGNVTVQADNVKLHGGGNISSVVFGQGRLGGDLDLSIRERLTISGHLHGSITGGVFTYADVGTHGKAGDIRIDAHDIQVTRNGNISALVFDHSTGDAGAIDVTARTISLTEGGVIVTSTYGSGAGGSITLRARGRLFLGTPTSSGALSGILANAGPGSTGQGGEVRIVAGSMELRDGGYVSSQTFSTGDSGDVRVIVRDALIADGATPFSSPSGIFANTNATAQGAAGLVRVRAGSIILSGGGEIASDTFGAGRGGNVIVDATQLSISGSMPAGFASGIFGSASSATTTGNAGSITVRAVQLDMADRGLISSTTSGPGDAGDVTVAVGGASITSGAGITTTSYAGGGRAGSISFSTPGLLSMSGTDAGLFSRTEGSNRAGKITLSAGDVRMQDGALVTVKSTGTGDAGDIRMIVGNSLQLSSGASITTGAASADGGNIDLKAGKLVYLKDSSITTSVSTAFGAGGNITIDPTFVVLDNGQIIAQAAQGHGGNISIISDYFLNFNGLVSASSDQGVSGSVLISSPNVNVGSGLVVLSGDYIDASRLIRESCASRAGRSGSTLISSGRGGLAFGPASGQQLPDRRPVALGCSPFQGMVPVLDAPASGDHHVAN